MGQARNGFPDRVGPLEYVLHVSLYVRGREVRVFVFGRLTGQGRVVVVAPGSPSRRGRGRKSSAVTRTQTRPVPVVPTTVPGTTVSRLRPGRDRETRSSQRYGLSLASDVEWVVAPSRPTPPPRSWGSWGTVSESSRKGCGTSSLRRRREVRRTGTTTALSVPGSSVGGQTPGAHTPCVRARSPTRAWVDRRREHSSMCKG